MTKPSKPLFSEYYLTRRLPLCPEWGEDIAAPLVELQQLYQNKQAILPTLNEAQTESEFIQPTLEILGFAYIPQIKTRRGGRAERPDYALFAQETTKVAAYPYQSNEAAFYDRVMAIAEAKYWERPLSKVSPNDNRDIFKNTNPSFQIVNYLTGTGVDWGILTNGRLWRLYYRQASSTATEFYQVDLVALLESPDLEAFKFFWLFFRRDAFLKDAQGNNFLERVRSGSTTYAQAIGDELKKLVFDQIFPAIAGGFVAYGTVPRFDLTDESGCRQVYAVTLSFLYKLLFLLYAEARNLLPMDNRGYRAQSLIQMARDIAERLERAEPLGQTSTALYDRLLNLFQLVDRGDPGFGLPRYNGGLFSHSSVTNQFLIAHKLADAVLAPALDRLARSNGEAIDYSFINVRHLGAIYEGLLEYRLVVDDAASGRVHLETDKGERKATGSYYTPDYIVKYIVRHTLEPILAERGKKFEQLMTQIVQVRHQLQDVRRATDSIRALRRDLERLELQAWEVLLDIKICDPAMGSGHFLVEAVDFLTDSLIDILNQYPEHNPVLQRLKSIRQDIIANLERQNIPIDPARLDDTQLLQRVVMKRCIYGVDLNPMAVELAKVSLWLHSFTVGAPLSFLDHHLRCGNSLIGTTARQAEAEMSQETSGQLTLLTGPFVGLLQAGQIMRGISILSDATIAEVATSEQLFKDFDQQAKPYKQLLDIYVSRHFGVKGAEYFLRRYGTGAISANPETMSKADAMVVQESRRLYAEKHFFHWDLEFPEVFIDMENASWKDNPGFDAVVGNPPYVRSIRLKEADPEAWAYYPNAYQAAAKREFDIYLCFAEQGLKSLNSQGHFGMIIPNKWFTTQVGKSLRTLLSERQAINSIVDFGHFQVFAEATTYTCLLFLDGAGGELVKLAILESADENAKPSPGGEGQWQLGSTSCNALGAESWNFSLDSTASIFCKLADLPQLKDIATVFMGTGTRADQVFLMERQDNLFYSRSLQQWVEIDSNLMRPSLTGRDIAPYHYDTDNYLLFPYNLGKEVNLIPPEEMAANYGKAWAYLNHPTNRASLECRDKSAFRNRADWYGYGRPQNMHLLGLPKIVLPDVAGRAEFACDFEGRYIIDTVYAIRLKEGIQISLLALTAILNSSVMTFFLQQTGTDLRGGYFRMKTAYLNPFPVPNITFTTPTDERNRYLEKAQSLYQDCVRQGKQDCMRGFVEHHLRQQPEQSDVVHDLLGYLAEQMIEMNKQKQGEIKGFLTWLERELGTAIDSLTNKTRLQNYLGDYQKSESHLTFNEILEILKKNRRKLQVDPTARKFQERLAQEYQASIDQLLPIKARLSATEQLIDQIVYRLYGLTAEEIAVIERK